MATAGHVDHGKSTLVRLLTGTDPDRWEEERRRGLTIDLGFAWCELGPAGLVGFVDVPGHHRFVRNALDGLAGADLALLVVSAREGWRAQTEEHAQVLDLLGVGGGVVALTHADVVDPSALDRARAEVGGRLAGTALAGAPVVATGAGDPASVAALRAALADQAGACAAPPDLDRPRLWVDRSFTLPGAGPVVTGTLVGGSVASGDHLAATGRGGGWAPVRVRSLHAWGRPAERAGPGTRVALGLAGADPPPGRGQAVARPAQWEQGTVLHVLVRPVRSRRPGPGSGPGGRLRARGAYTVALGTAHVPAQLRHPAPAAASSPSRGRPRHALGGEGEGEGAELARLHLARPLGPVAPGDRFVLLDDGGGGVAGGGVVLAVGGDRHPAPGALAGLAAAVAGTGDRRAALARALLDQHGGAVAATVLEAAVGTPTPPGTTVVGDVAVAGDALDELVAELVGAALAAGPGGAPLPGHPAGAVARHPAAEAVARHLDGQGRLRWREGRLWPPGARPHDDALDGALARVGPVLAASSPAVLAPAELARRAGVGTRAVGDLVRRGDLAVAGDVVGTPAEVERLVGVVRAHLARGPAPTGELRALLGLPRRHAVAVLEWLDAGGVTHRCDGGRALGPGPAGPP